MFQANDLLLTKPFTDLSAAVGSVGNVAAVTTVDPVVIFPHIESNVLFQTIGAPNNVTRIIIFGGSIIHVVDSTTTRIYDVKLNCILQYSVTTKYIPESISIELVVTLRNNDSVDKITILSNNSRYVTNPPGNSYDFFQIIGFRYKESTIQANLVLRKSFFEGIVNGNSLIPVEFYLFKPALGNIPFQEFVYTVHRSPDGLTEVTQLAGVLAIPSAGDYTVILDLTRTFATSTDLQTKSVNSQVSINKLNTSEKLFVDISTQEVIYDSSTKFYLTRFSANVLGTIAIDGSFVVPSNRNWNSKPQDLTFNYQK